MENEITKKEIMSEEIQSTNGRSSSIKELATALSKVQAAMTPAKKDSENPFFKSRYADLASVWDACRVHLTSNGLSVSQMPETQNGHVIVKTILMHASGEYLEGSLTMTPTANTPQGIGSCITYARRYALSAIVGVCPDDDDDGNAASRPTKQNADRPQDRGMSAPAAPASNGNGLTVASVDEKRGKNSKTGNPWTRFDIKLSDGREASTFSDSIAATAKAAHLDRSTVTVEVKTGFKDKLDIVSLTLAEGVQSAPPAQNDLAPDDIPFGNEDAPKDAGIAVRIQEWLSVNGIEEKFLLDTVLAAKLIPAKVDSFFKLPADVLTKVASPKWHERLLLRWNEAQKKGAK